MMESLKEKLGSIKGIFQKRVRALGRQKKVAPTDTPEDKLKSQLRAMINKADITEEDNAKLKNLFGLYIASTDPTHPFLTQKTDGTVAPVVQDMLEVV